MGRLRLKVTDKPTILDAKATLLVAKDLDRLTNREGSLLVGKVKRRITKMGKVDQGELRKSISYETHRSGSRNELKVGPGAKHAIFVHEGTKPHWAPLGSLLLWAKRVKPELNPIERTLFAKRVQFKIARYGTEAHPFLAEVFEEESPNVRDRFHKEVRQIFKNRFHLSLGGTA
jgi:HK97 gp10 family phage protein